MGEVSFLHVSHFFYKYLKIYVKCFSLPSQRFSNIPNTGFLALVRGLRLFVCLSSVSTQTVASMLPETFCIIDTDQNR